jgi:site-specific DNA-methyltransferase (adenine-specific)
MDVSMIEKNKIYHSDCLDFMKSLSNSDTKVNLIVTSPPYNINKEYGMYNDNKERNEYLYWLYCVAQHSYSILDNDGSFFLNISGKPSDPTIPFDVVKEFSQAGYELQNTIHWIKSISFEKDDLAKTSSINKDLSIGHFKPIVSQRYLTDAHEYIFHFTKKGDIKLDKLSIGVPYQDKTNIGRWKSVKQDKRDRGNVWFIPYPTIQEGRPHPAVFPEKLPYLCIKLQGIKNDMLVYDPFMGSGSTALACLYLNIDYIGTEIDQDYIDIAEKNIEERKRDLYQKKNNLLTMLNDSLSENETTS